MSVFLCLSEHELSFQDAVCARLVASVVEWFLCLCWPGDFLLPEALKVITVEEGLSSAATPVWSSPQHFALTSQRDHSKKSQSHLLLFILENLCEHTGSVFIHLLCISDAIVDWVISRVWSVTDYRSIDSHWFLWSARLSWLRLFSVLDNNWDSSSTLGSLVLRDSPGLAHV